MERIEFFEKSLISCCGAGWLWGFTLAWPFHSLMIQRTHFSKVLYKLLFKKILVQSTLVIVYLVIVESLDIVDRAVWPIVYFSMFLSRNSGISCNSGQFLGDQKIHYYECRLYCPLLNTISARDKYINNLKNVFYFNLL